MAILEMVQAVLAGPRPLPLVLAGDPVLRRPAEPYTGQLPDDLLAELLDAMRETMLAAPGVGLAAPQVGIGVQIAVLEDSAAVAAEYADARERTPLPFRVLVNPRCEPVGEQVAAFYEGCLSVPGYQAVVRRARTVRLRAQDERGADLDEQISGWAARIVAHETDHLAGRLYLDAALLRSLSTTANYQTRWAFPDPTAAGTALGF